MEGTIDKSLVEKAIDLKSSLAKLRTLLNVDGESNVPQWCKDRMQELDEHLKEEKFIRSKQEESYDAITKYNKELMGQMEALTKSREKVEERLHRSEEAVHLEKKLLENKENKWKQEKAQLELENSQKQAKIETLNARNGYYQKENEDFKNDHRRAKAIQKDLDELKEEMKKKEAENEALKKEMAEKQAASEEQYNQEVQKRENVEKRLEDTEATLNQELKETKSKLEKAEEEVSSAAKSLASFLAVIKETIGDKEDGGDDDDDDVVDLDLESNVSKIGVTLENMQTMVADTRDETDELKRELEELREKWHESRGELMDLSEDFEIQERRHKQELEKLLEDLEHKTKSKQAMVDHQDEEQSYDSMDEKEDEMEATEEEQPDRSPKAKQTMVDDEEKEESYDNRDENEDEVEAIEEELPDKSMNEDEMEPAEQERPTAPQNDDQSDDSDIVEVLPPSNGPAKRPREEDEEVPADRDDGDDSQEDPSSDIEVVQPPQDTNTAKRPLEEDEEASNHAHADDSNEGDQDQLAPTAKRAKIDEDSDGEGSTKSVTFGIDSIKEDDSSDIVEVQPPDASSTKPTLEEDEEVQVLDQAPTAKRPEVDEETDSDGSGYGSF
mmetsp:Transcript_42223/g.102040  ORF Transcript_42223/g.102040 Transcript_42223/m.102040 type:complete len:613 (+) Transcript_42223:595-2433(+)